ncbi:MAG: penicillin-binding transpeptidase domain-containing protein [Negativicutes bacterium]
MLKYDLESNYRQRKNIYNVAIFLLLLFAAIAVYLCYVQIFNADFLNNNTHNRRSYFFADSIKRGAIIDRNGVVLAHSVKAADGKYYRIYDYGAAFANITGYYSKKYGKTGIEAQYDDQLSGANNSLLVFGPIARLWQTEGADVVLTIDARVQLNAYNALGRYNGAAVAINPQTGEILAFVSKPEFNPNYLDDSWQSLINDKNSPLIDRAAQGLYPPGSTIKAMMAAESLHYGVIDQEKTMDCAGQLKIGDYELIDDNHEVHGKINIKDALIDSCNIFFGQLAIDSGRGKTLSYFRDFKFGQSVPNVLNSVSAVIPDLHKLGDGDLAQTGIGQGGLLVTPLQMALVTAAIANDGVVELPYFVSSIRVNDKAVKTFYPQRYFSVADKDSMTAVRDMMEAVVKRGTGTSVRIPGVRVGGKTGTAQNPHGESHSWFVGFAPVDNPKVCVAVIAENAGYGAGIAASVARQIIIDTLGR